MPKNINSAYRIKKIIGEARNANDNTKTLSVWADLFNVAEEDTQKRAFIISKFLSEMHEEIEIVREDMNQSNFSHELYENTLNRCNSIFSVQSINSDWREIKNQISNDIMISLGFCSEILPHEENEISEDAIKELLTLIQDLELKLSDSSLPIRLRKIIELHVSKIKDALSLYKIKGAAQLNESIKFAFGEVLTNKDLIDESKESKEFQSLCTIWKKSIAILNAVVTADSRITAIQNLANYSFKLLDIIEHIH